MSASRVSRALLVTGGLLVAGCGSNPAVESDATSSTTTALPEGSDQNGTVIVGPSTYEFMAKCYLPGDGNITVTGAGFDPATGAPVDLLLRNVPAQPYFGMRINGALIEAALDSDMSFTVDEGRIEASALEFVQDLDLLTGEGEALGTGSITVQCDTYVDGTP